MVVAGDIYDEDQILQWLMTQKDPSGDAIEELEGDALRNFIDESEYLAVYFCRFLNSHLISKTIKKESNTCIQKLK